LIPAYSEAILTHFKHKDIHPQDFYGYYLEANAEEFIVNAGLHKP
jgi:hypothetical protein